MVKVVKVAKAVKVAKVVKVVDSKVSEESVAVPVCNSAASTNMDSSAKRWEIEPTWRWLHNPASAGSVVAASVVAAVKAVVKAAVKVVKAAVSKAKADSKRPVLVKSPCNNQ